ncbi:GlxA family transcriptional regulator [Azohydromonas caseinilytica]|uniref:GlxA family transcriptional regulator n=1 Tax=Azohydromonas caseinilytica TaxID=2728836 RepID=A0A848FFQ3_9BURK|nr:GlxA family transcriptional regulator [Azohydromonas caseinilytica]NML18092.1 GlxA family transcriptional regulator [Azohydromonas caseinilytica]
MESHAHEKAESKLRVGFVLSPRFTLTAFAGFVDALRLAADEGDRSRPLLAHWAVLDATHGPVVSSCGVSVTPDAPLASPEQYDYLVVVGGLLHGGQQVPVRLMSFLREAAAAGVNLVGLCTGSFVLARAGLLDGHVACVSWFHREEFAAEFPDCRIVSNQMFVADRDRLTCAGGTSVVHLAAHIIERFIGRASAVKALRIMIEEQPLPARTLQPEEVVSVRSTDTVVHKAMLILEQKLDSAATIDELCEPLGIGRRQLERRFQRDVGLSPAEYRSRLRLERARWLLQNTDLDVIEVSFECGFHEGASFARFVRRGTGMSPRDVRQMGRRAAR